MDSKPARTGIEIGLRVADAHASAHDQRSVPNRTRDHLKVVNGAGPSAELQQAPPINGAGAAKAKTNGASVTPAFSDPLANKQIARLYREYAGPLTGFVQKRVENGEDAADIVQDIFVRIVANKLAEAIRDPAPFLYRAAHNAVIDFIRSDYNRKAGVSVDYMSVQEALADESVTPQEQRLEANDVLAAIDGLRSRRKARILTLKLCGENNHEIAEKVGVSLATVKREMSAALLLIRKRLDAR